MSQMKQQHQKQKKRPAPAEPAGKRPGPKPSHKTDAPKAAPKLLTKREQKEVVKSKKLKFKKNYATIQETVLLWEKLRPKQSTDEEKAQLVSTILKKLQGNIPELANHHSASRVIQWCLKVGSPGDKARLTGEVRANIVMLSKSKYGRHVVQKLINVAGKDEVPGLAKLFKGHVAELLRHPSGADVLDDLYSVCPTPCRNMLCCELYGREFTLFEGVGTHSDGISHLGDLLAGVDAAKRQAVLRHLYKGLAPVLEKALLHPVMTHRLLRELLTEAPGSVVADVVDTLAATGGNALKLVHTHDGAAAAAMALAYGSPKDRKRLVKGMKGYVWQTADNEWGHAVVATALSVVDDTALTSKTILSELKGHLEELCTSPHAHRVLMQLLAPDSRRYLPPATYEMLHPPQKTMLVAAGSTAASGGSAGGGGLDDDDEVLDEEQLQLDEGDGEDEEPGQEDEEAAAEDEEMQDADEGEEVEEGAAAAAEQPKEMVQRVLGESKKAPDVRRTELLGSGPGSLSAALLALCAEQAGELLRSPVGGDVLVEVARGAAGGLLWQLDQPAVAAVHAAVVQLVAQDCSRVHGAAAAAAAGAQEQQPRKKGGKPAKAQQQQQQQEEEADGDQQHEPLLTHYYGSRALRRLLLAGEQAGPDGAGARALAESLWSQALQGQCQQLLGSHAEKVLAGLLHCGVASVVQAATAELQPLLGGVEVAAWAAKFMGPGSGGGKAAGKRKHKGAAAAAAGGAGAGEQQQQQLSRQKGQQKQKRSAAAAAAGGEGEQQQQQQQQLTAAAAKRKKKAKS